MIIQDYSSVIAACLTGFVSIILFAIGAYINRLNFEKPSKLKIYRQQLFLVFEQLEKILVKSDFILTAELQNKIENIIDDNYSLVPPFLAHSYTDMIEEKKYRDIFFFRDIVTTYYNWTKRTLGYPYSREGINIACLESRDLFPAIVQILKKWA